MAKVYILLSDYDNTEDCIEALYFDKELAEKDLVNIKNKRRSGRWFGILERDISLKEEFV